MVFIGSIQELQYYNLAPNQLCYCEYIVFPFDMHLQSRIAAGGSYSMTIYLYDVTGVNQIANITSSFDIYYFNFGGNIYFNARLNTFPPSMCANPCFILRVQVDSGSLNIFDKYTERYCVPSCCLIPQNITHSNQEITPEEEAPALEVVGTINTIVTTQPVTDCGDKLIRLTTYFDCYDPIHDVVYGIPGNIVSGSASFGYQIITNLRGRVVRQPRDINVVSSFNCRLLRVESVRQYFLEGYEYFPTWKMEEIEQGFHGQHIEVNDYRISRELKYTDGAAFRQINACYESWKLEITLQECRDRATFSCDDCAEYADGQNLMTFQIGQEFIQRYLNESGKLIGDEYEQLLAYYRQFGVVTDRSSEAGSPCVFNYAFTVESNIPIPTSFFINERLAKNRIYGQSGDLIPCDDTFTSCAYPELGTGIITDMTCATPILGTGTPTAITAEDLDLFNSGSWVKEADTVASKYANQVTLNIKTEDTTKTGTEDILIGGETILFVEPAGIPSLPRTIIIDDINYIIVETSGAIRYYGYGTTTVTETTIEHYGLIYNL